MSTAEIILGIAGFAIACVVFWFMQTWVIGRYAKRLVAALLAKKAMSGDRPKLSPESDYVVAISETQVVCERPNGTTESVQWNDLQRVEILTTEDGPFAPDVFWVLYGTTDGCVIPWGASGDQALMDRLQELPDFQNEAVVFAATLTTNSQILCWERIPQDA